MRAPTTERQIVTSASARGAERKRILLPGAVLLAALAVVAAAGCNDTSSTSPTTSQTLYDTLLTGTVQPPVGGVLQSSFNTFVVGQGGGTVSLTLTSAVETLAGGTQLPTVVMGLGVGSVTGSGATATCTLLSNAYTTAQAGATPQLSGSIDAGTYCAVVSDVTNQTGPVLYGVLVTHP